MSPTETLGPGGAAPRPGWTWRASPHTVRRMSRFLPGVALALSVVSCAAPTPTPASLPAGPRYVEVDGRVAHPLDEEQLGDDVRALVTAFEEVMRAPLDPPADTSLASMQRWAESVFGPYLVAQRERAVGLEELAGDVVAANGPDDARLAALLVGAAWEHVFETIEASPVPDSIAADDELLQIYRDTLRGAALPAAHRAADAYRRCADAEPPAHSRAREWWLECGRRAENLAALQTPTRPAEPTQRALPARVEWPAHCLGSTAEAPPRAPPPDRSEPASVAVRWTGRQLEDPVRSDLLAAVHAKLSAVLDLRLVSLDEVARAEALQRDRRLRQDGPQCGQPPSIGWILSETHPNLVLAEVSTDCAPERPRTGCELRVFFTRPGDRGASDAPSSLFAPLAPGSPRPWHAAAEALGPPRARFGAIGVLAAERSAHLRVVRDEDEDPWLRIVETLSEDEALRDCAPSGAVAAFDVRLRVSPTGQPSAVRVSPGEGAMEEAADCVGRAIEGTRWPCTPSGASHEIEIGLCVAPR